MSSTNPDSADAHLVAQYEAYPYPRRDPRDEAKRLIVGSPGHLREIDHWVFGARRSAAQPLHALIAGGGTGDCAIMLAQQMANANRPGSVTWLDRSAAAEEIVRGRAAARGLTNLRFVRASLLDLPASGLGPFDYIDCCGVLHHLPDPLAGLRALTSVLAPDGGLGLMVYAPFGRTGVYMLQDALAALAPIAEAPAARLDVAKRVMKQLPETAWLRRNPYFSDHIDGGDAGLYDLLLNPRDRAFDIPKLFDLLGKGGVVATCLLEPMRYDPATWLIDPRLRQRIAGMDAMQKAALAEALTGNMSTHVVYCVRGGQPVAEPDPLDPNAVPVGREMPAMELARHVRPDHTLPLVFDGLRVSVALPKLAVPILQQIDGQKRVGEIAAIMAQRGVSVENFQTEWLKTFRPLAAANRLLLAAPA